jgi:hypothetical protein
MEGETAMPHAWNPFSTFMKFDMNLVSGGQPNLNIYDFLQ